ncbi:MAG: hypothetical protein LBV54_02815 [Puniceicoccales bacterium]|jgi:hypothetical protein|nr:hypothetical protein [Puniceicoccales bacterium]
MPDVTYSSPKLAAELRKLFGNQVKTIQIKPNPVHATQIDAFIKRIEATHQAAAKSQLVFK